jgi:hypothetical protein
MPLKWHHYHHHMTSRLQSSSSAQPLSSYAATDVAADHIGSDNFDKFVSLLKDGNCSVLPAFFRSPILLTIP